MISSEKFLNKEDLSNEELLLSLINYSLENSYSFALWKEPNSKSKNLMIDTSKNIKKEKLTFEEKGFAFSPFQIENTNLAYILKPDILVMDDEIYINGINIPSLREFYSDDSLYKYTDKIIQNKSFEKSKKEDFINLINKVLEQIDNSKLNKAVVSRIKEKKLPKDFSPINLFDLLCYKYDSAFISMIFSPELGFWLGASPELLLGLNENKINTMSLAATQSYYEGMDLNNIEWSEKEIEEQKYVSVFIKNSLEKLNIKNFSETTKNIRAGNIVHLRTLFEFESESQKETASKLLSSINPTPAVLGTPIKESLSFILENEPHKREFYCGFLGPLNINKNSSSLYVNLRCLQFHKDTAYLYIGAGIIKGSIPEKEWMETELKSQTLLSVIESML